MNPPSSSRPRHLALAWHFDFHTPGKVRVNRRADPEGLAEELKAGGVEEVTAFCKCHYGYAYYPTRVGTRHPRLRGNLFGGVLKACRRRGLRVMAYLSFGIDGEAAKRHPAWRQLTRDRVNINNNLEPDNTVQEGGFLRVCPFTGYMDRLMLPQIAEVVEAYRPDGFFFDTMSALAPCYCASCRREFRRVHGREIPRETGEPSQALFGQWRHDRGIALVERVARFIRDRLPGAAVGFNQLGSLPYPERMPEGVNLLTLDPATHGPQSLQMSLNAAFGVATGMACDVMPTVFNQGWGDWSLGTELRMEQVAASVWARGARLYVGDRLHPEGRFAPATPRAVRTLKRVRRELGRVFPPAEARPVADILLLHGQHAMYGDRMELFADGNGRNSLECISGAHRLFLDSGASFMVSSEGDLARWVGKVRLVVVPELRRVSPQTEQTLREHVVGGGQLLLAGTVPRVGRGPLDWCGVEVGARPWQDHLYLPPWSPRSEELPVLVRGWAFPMRRRGAHVVLPAILGYDARPDAKYGWGMGPFSGAPSHHPVLTRHALGRGAVWFLGAPVFSDYAKHGNWQLVGWWKGLLERMKLAQRVWMDSPAGAVELVTWENAASTWAILIQHGGEELHGSKTAWSRTLALPRPSVLTLRVRERGGGTARAVVGNRPVRMRSHGGICEIRVPMDRVCEVVRVDWSPRPGGQRICPRFGGGKPSPAG